MSFFNRYELLGALAGLFYRLYSSTWSYRVHFVEKAAPVDFYTKHPDQSFVFGHWHGDELALIGICKHSKFLTLSSQSKDGTIMAAGLKVMGFEVVRGSSTRGGMRGLVAMLKKLSEGHYYFSFALDGPNGPRFEAKAGAHLFAYKTGLPLYQCLVTCNRKWNIPNTWNKSYLPKPFAKVDLYFYPVPRATKSNRDEVLKVFNSRTMV
ncbi:MAG: DUF374 domain-containing protein [Desulfobacteraceae bacterium]|nr:MAG: DUF374 domain-containing protein [Desulfobacteraceae bacterium]